MTDVYYSVNPFGTGDQKTGSPNMTVSSGVMTLTVSQTGNIGEGCVITANSIDYYISAVNSPTSFDVVTVTGATPSNVGTPTAVTSISAVWASLSAAEAAISGASFLNTQDLVTNTYTVYLSHYYDQDDSTPDSANTEFDSSWSTDSTYKFIFYAPDNTQATNDQRAVNGADSARQIAPRLRIQSNVDIDILDIQLNSSTYGIRQDDGGDGTGVVNAKRLIVEAGSGSGGVESEESTLNIENSIINGSYFGLACNGGTLNADYCDIFGNTIGIYRASGTCAVKNCAIFDNGDDFNGTITSSYCASDDNDNGGTGDYAIHGTYEDLFTTYDTDLTLENYTSTGALIEQADPIGGITTDKAGNARDGTSPDVGPFEYQSAGGSYDMTCADGFKMSDTVAMEVSADMSMSDGFSVSDSSSQEAGANMSESDGFSMSDQVSNEIAALLSGTDSFVFSDQLAASVTAAMALVDGFDFSDEASLGVEFTLTMSDGFLFSDSLGAAAEISMTLSDGFSMSDAVSEIVNAVQNMSDGFIMSDIASITEGGIAEGPLTIRVMIKKSAFNIVIKKPRFRALGKNHELGATDDY